MKLFGNVVDDLIVGAIALAAFVLIVAAMRLFLAVRDRRENRFFRNRSRLIEDAAAELGAMPVGDPRVTGVPYLKSRLPDPPYGLALAPVGGGQDPYFPIFEAPINGANFLEAWPSGSPYPPLRVSMGGDGVLVGDPEFEAAYIVRADDPHFARSLLGPEARGLIDEGRRIGAGGRLRINVDRHRLRIRKEEPLSSPRDLAAFARVGVGLLERVREAIESLQAVQYFDAPPQASRPHCPVCSGEVIDRRVECRRCHTPHHRECWDYTGTCSVFACGESRFSL